MKRLAGLILILVAVFSLAIAGADSLQTEEYIGEYTFPVTIETGSGISSEQAAENYIMQAFGFLDRPSGGALLEGTVELSGANQILYEKLVTLVRKIAEGRETTAVCEIPMTDFGIQLSYTVQELGASSITDSDIGDKFYGKVAQEMNLNLDLVWNKLRSDYPYEMFWASNQHRTSGGYPSASVKWDDNTGNYVVCFPDDSVFSYPLYVIADYSATQTEGTSQLDENVMTAVTSAVDNANAIVADNAGKSDYDKLKGYKDAICGLTSYNHAAAGDSDFNENAWQLVWALDDDPETKVVCEGYSKAFKALCDLGTFMDDSVSASIVTGKMSGGNHMWNLVQIQGQQYLVDVTNCDTGMVGHPNELFLAGYSSVTSDGKGYIYRANEQDITYTYDNIMYNLYAAEDLEVSHDPFVEQPIIMASATEIALGESVTLTVRVPGQDEFHIYQEKDGSGSWLDGPGSTANGQDFLVYTYTPEAEGLYSFYAGYKNATTGTLERTAASVQVNVVYTPPEPITVTGAMKVGTDVTITISKEEEWENLCLEIDYVPNEANRVNILREWVVPNTQSVIGTYFQNAGTYQVKLSQINELEGGGLDYNNPVQLATVNFDMEAQTLIPCPGSISATEIVTGDELTYTAEGAEALAYQIWLDEYTTGERVTEMNSPISPDQTTETVSIAYGTEYGAYGFLGGYIWAKINGVWTLPKEFQVTVHPLGTLADPIVQWRIDQSVGDSLTLSPGMTTSLAVTADGADRVFWRLADENGNSIDGGSFEGATGEIDLANDFTAGAEYSLRITPRKLGYQSVDRVIVVRCWDVPTVPEQILPGQDIIVHHNPVEGAVSYNVGLWDMNTGMICYDEDREEPGDFIIPAAAFADGGSYNLGIGVSNGDMGDWLWIDVPYNNVTAYTANTPLTVTPVLERVAGYKNASFILSVESPERVLVQEGVVVDGTSSWGAFLDIVATPGQMVSFASVEYDEFYGNATYRFCALKNGAWTQWSNPVTINVTEGQMMKAADYTPQGTVEQLPADLQRIEEKAFENVLMTEVDIPTGVTFIADDAFDGCGLVAIYTHNNQVAVDFALDHGIIALTD